MLKLLSLPILPMLLLAFYSCSNSSQSTLLTTVLHDKESFDAQAFSTQIKTVFRTVNDTIIHEDKLSLNDALSLLYQKNNYAPLWLSSKKDTTAIEHFLNELSDIYKDGIDTQDYAIAKLKKEYNDYIAEKNKDVHQAIHLDTSFTYTYLKASHDLLFGTIKPQSVDSLWFHANDTAWQLDKIIHVFQTQHYLSLDSFKSDIHAYNLMKKALAHYRLISANDSLLTLKNTFDKSSKTSDSIAVQIISLEAPWLAPISDSLKGNALRIQAYQQYFGLKRTGKLDSTTVAKLKQSPENIIKLLAANMERVRWMPQSFEEEYALVNIPTMQMRLTRNNEKVIGMNVVVGKPSRQTPVLNALMRNIVINPPWGVPPTILKKDVLPGMMRSGSAYLRKKGLQVYDGKGKKVDASIVNADNYKRYFYKQAPGDDNALGYVKFNFPNAWDIYMHDTPHRSDFEKFDRARSSGCVRLQRPQELAKYILNEMEDKDFSQERIDSLISTHKTKYEVLKNKIPVHIVYLTAFEDETGNNIRFARDFYQRDQKLMASISK